MSWRDRLQTGLPPRHPVPPRGDGIARLDLNEGAFPPDPGELAVMRQALDGIEFNRYPDDGAPALRATLAGLWQVAPEEILIGNGSIEIAAILMLAFRRPQAKLLLPVPTFDQFGALAALHGYETIPLHLDADFRIDEAAALAAIGRHRPALAFFASPNNPTGNRFSPEVLERLAVSMDAAFVIDEAYADFASGNQVSRAPAIPGLFVMRSLSKIGLAGLRLGALIGAGPALAEIERARLPFNVSAQSQALGRAALAYRDRMEARVAAIVRLRRSFADDLSRLPGLRVYPSEANFLLVRTNVDAARLCGKLRARGVAVRDVSDMPGLEGCLRITVGTASENRRCVQALATGE